MANPFLSALIKMLLYIGVVRFLVELVSVTVPQRTFFIVVSGPERYIITHLLILLFSRVHDEMSYDQ